MRLVKSVLTAVLLMGVSAVALGESIVFDAENDWAPYSSKSLATGQAEGVAVNIVTSIFHSVGLVPEIRPVPYGQCLEDIKRPTGVLGCFNTVREEANEKAYAWPTEPLLFTKVIVWARHDFPTSGLGLKDLLNKKVAVTNGFEYGKDFDTNTAIQKVVGANDTILFQKLINARADFAVVYEHPGTLVLNRPALLEQKNLVKPVGALNELPLYLAFTTHNRRSSYYLDLFNKGMENIKQDGTYEKIMSEFIKNSKGSATQPIK